MELISDEIQPLNTPENDLYDRILSFHSSLKSKLDTCHHVHAEDIPCLFLDIARDLETNMSELFAISFSSRRIRIEILNRINSYIEYLVQLRSEQKSAITGNFDHVINTLALTDFDKSSTTHRMVSLKPVQYQKII